MIRQQSPKIVTNWRRHQTCEKKKVYYIRDVAIRAAKNARERTGEDIVAYSCEYCGNYHIGHNR